jgi:hypothetical protein
MTPEELERLRERAYRPFPWGTFALICLLSAAPLVILQLL